jgi:polysaccharide export outer membrane protein
MNEFSLLEYLVSSVLDAIGRMKRNPFELSVLRELLVGTPFAPVLHFMCKQSSSEAFVSNLSRFSASILSGVLLAGCAATVLRAAQAPDPATAPQQDKNVNLKGAKATPEKGSTSSKPTTPAIPGVQAPPDYRVGVDDELMISVWHEPELSQAVVVRPDGMITLPLINDIRVVGMTTQELQTTLTDQLKGVVNEPQVTIVVKSIKSQKVFLMGAVGKQGVYPMSGSVTVLQLIAQGGGLSPFAKLNSIYILRHENGKDVRIPVKYKKALAGKTDDALLQPGDMLVVP